MARLLAQLLTAVFFVVGIGGLLLGTAGSVSQGHAGGNLGSVTLHLTWFRDVVDIGLCLVFAYVGFVAATRTGGLVSVAAGALLLLLAVAGFVVGDNDAATKGVAGLNFPTAVNVFDLVIGLLALLAGLGTLADLEASSP